MKTNIYDFLFSGLAISFILSGSISIIWFLVSPLTKAYLGDYHVIANFFVFLLLYGLLSGFLVQLLLKVKPFQYGDFSMEDSQFTYWKLLTVIYLLGEFFLMPFTTVFTKPLIAKLFGAKIGKNVAIAGTIDDPYSVTIGDNSIIGQGSLVSGNFTINDKIHFGKVIIGENVTIGVNSVVSPDTQINDNSIISIGAVVLTGTKIPCNEMWRGNPARSWQPISAKIESTPIEKAKSNEARDNQFNQPIKINLG